MTALAVLAVLVLAVVLVVDRVTTSRRVTAWLLVADRTVCAAELAVREATVTRAEAQVAVETALTAVDSSESLVALSERRIVERVAREIRRQLVEHGTSAPPRGGRRP